MSAGAVTIVCAVLDGHVPLGADRVPEQLVVVVEVVQRALHRVGDDVGVLPGDGDVRVADADASDVALGRDLRVGRRARASRSPRRAERVHAVVLVVEREAGRDVAEDAVPLVRPEVVRDDLGDLEVAVVLDRDRRAVVGDALGRLRAPRGATGQRAGTRTTAIRASRRRTAHSLALRAGTLPA